MMTNDRNPSKGELILSEDHSLSILKSGLVKRGIDLLNEGRKKTVNILMAAGSWDDHLPRLWKSLLEVRAGDKYEFNFVRGDTSDEILKLAQTYKFDLFMLVLNNIVFSDDNFPVGNRLEKAMQLVTRLKTTYGRPVVTFSGIRDLEDKARQAGADFYFQLPFKVDDVNKAFVFCLNNLS